ncbi:MAG: hypothetical protein M5R40_09840 [Anaerolineae bacterium]|nr:hypothetical protein [Anaerolineae bacterium]
MSAFFHGLGNLISQIFRNIRPVGLVLLALATVLIGLRIITTNETLAPLVLPAFASFWVTAFYFARREDLKEPVKGRLAALTAGLWATFAAGIVLREAVPILFALWTFGYLPVWFLIFIIVLLWPGRDGDKRPKLLAREGRLFEVKKLGEDLFEETPIPGWAYKKAEIEVWADTAVVVDREGAKPRVIRHTSDPDDVIIDKTETVRAIVDLRQQIRREDAVPVMTRDGIAVKIDLFVGFQLERHARPSLEDPYPVLDSAVIRAVYKHAIFDHADDAAVKESEQQTDWYDYPLYRLKIRLHDIIAQYALSELYEHLAQVPPGPEEDAALRIPGDASPPNWWTAPSSTNSAEKSPSKSSQRIPASARLSSPMKTSRKRSGISGSGSATRRSTGNCFPAPPGCRQTGCLPCSGPCRGAAVRRRSSHPQPRTSPLEAARRQGVWSKNPAKLPLSRAILNPSRRGCAAASAKARQNWRP